MESNPRTSHATPSDKGSWSYSSGWFCFLSALETQVIVTPEINNGNRAEWKFLENRCRAERVVVRKFSRLWKEEKRRTMQCHSIIFHCSWKGPNGSSTTNPWQMAIQPFFSNLQWRRLVNNVLKSSRTLWSWRCKMGSLRSSRARITSPFWAKWWAW